MSRFVILEHDFPELHWDFMLEVGGVLKSWRLSRNPLEHPQIRKVEKIADHRTYYLDYEGEVSGNRGTVKSIDRGEYRELKTLPACWKLELKGQTLRGRLTLTKRDDDFWCFDFEKK